MKMVFKPLEVLRLRLYHVTLAWPVREAGGDYVTRYRTEHRYVFGQSPRGAAAAVAQQYANLSLAERPGCTGHAVSIGQPAEWFEDQRESPQNCEHSHEFIESSRGGQVEHAVYLCRLCGELNVRVRHQGMARAVEINFGLGCDDHLRAASRYLRTPLEAQEAQARLRGTAPRGDARPTIAKDFLRAGEIIPGNGVSSPVPHRHPWVGCYRKLRARAQDFVRDFLHGSESKSESESGSGSRGAKE